MHDLLAYSSIIENDYDGTRCLSYDTHFRTLAASMQLQKWSQVDQSLWSQHFNRSVLKVSSGGALAIGPYHGSELDTSKSGRKHNNTGSKGKEHPSLYTRSPILHQVE